MEAPDPAPRRILVVDDDTFLRMLISMEVPHVELLEASRADEAFELAVREKPDAILLDLRLPDADGTELLRRLRRTAPLAQTPILVITAGHDEAERAAITKAGADEYLAKPVDAADLVARLERILSVPPAERRHRRHDLVDRVGAEPGGDPDPVPDARLRDAAARVEREHAEVGVAPGTGGWLRRLFRRGR